MKSIDKREVTAADNSLDMSMNSLSKHKNSLLRNGISKERLRDTLVAMGRLSLELSVIRERNGFGSDSND